MKNANQSISLGSNGMPSFDLHSGLTFFLIDLLHFQLHMQQNHSEMFMFFSWDVDHFIFPLWLLWIKWKSLKMRDLMSSSNGTKCQFSFELISFSLENTHTHKLSIEMFCCMNDGDAFAYAFRVTAFFSHLTFFFVYGLFFRSFFSQIHDTFFFFTVYFTIIFRDSNTFCRFDGIVLL